MLWECGWVCLMFWYWVYMICRHGGPRMKKQRMMVCVRFVWTHRANYIPKGKDSIGHLKGWPCGKCLCVFCWVIFCFGVCCYAAWFLVSFILYCSCVLPPLSLPLSPSTLSLLYTTHRIPSPPSQTIRTSVMQGISRMHQSYHSVLLHLLLAMSAASPSKQPPLLQPCKGGGA